MVAGVVTMVLLITGTAFGEEWLSAAPIPRGAEEVYEVAARGKLYVFGGLDLDWKPMGMVMEYDPTTDRWVPKGNMPTPSHHMALVEVEGRMHRRSLLIY